MHIRASMLTGLRPDTLGIYDFSHFGGLKLFRTIPSHFHRLGYQTSNSGKIFHWESSWHYSSNYWGSPAWEYAHDREKIFINSSVTPDWVNSMKTDFFRDSIISSNAVQFLKSMNKRPEPWLLTVGFKGTHMPYHMPKQYWDMYDHIEADPNYIRTYNKDSFKFPSTTPLVHYITKTEETSVRYMVEEGAKKGVEKEYYQTRKEMSIRARNEIYRGYLASLSYFDNELGKILDVMDELNLWESTIVVFTSDHGMHLGEKGIWGKWTLFDEASRVPLIIHAPQFAQSFGMRYAKPVELIDIFPTLIDLTDTDTATNTGPPEELWPQSCSDTGGESEKDEKEKDKRLKRPFQGEGPVRNADGHILRHYYCDHMDGVSLLPIFKSFGSGVSDAFTEVSHKEFAVTQRMTCKMPGTKDINPDTNNWIDFCPFKKLPRDPERGAMGYALRSSEWRYIAWLEWDTNSFLPGILNQLPTIAC